MRAGDTLAVHSMDRLARNLDDLHRLVQQLTRRGVRIEFVKKHLTFSGEDSPMANLMLSVRGALLNLNAPSSALQNAVAVADRQIIKLERQQCAKHRIPRFRLVAETGAPRFLASEVRCCIRSLGDGCSPCFLYANLGAPTADASG